MKVKHTFDSLQSDSLAHFEHNDCSVKALAVATGEPYDMCLKALESVGRKPRGGASLSQILLAAINMGYGVREDVDFMWARTMISAEHELRLRKRGRKYMMYVNNHIVGFNGESVVDWTRGRRHKPKIFIEIVDESLHDRELGKLVGANK